MNTEALKKELSKPTINFFLENKQQLAKVLTAIHFGSTDGLSKYEIELVVGNEKVDEVIKWLNCGGYITNIHPEGIPNPNSHNYEIKELEKTIRFLRDVNTETIQEEQTKILKKQTKIQSQQKRFNQLLVIATFVLAIQTLSRFWLFQGIQIGIIIFLFGFITIHIFEISKATPIWLADKLPKKMLKLFVVISRRVYYPLQMLYNAFD
ncbi:hypothetical protein HY636_00425 [Candidatus Woesearchaeota archaeon]|nr:hypothetical protein [Candidatus Woesearchaeota archaeon]